MTMQIRVKHEDGTEAEYDVLEVSLPSYPSKPLLVESRHYELVFKEAPDGPAE